MKTNEHVIEGIVAYQQCPQCKGKGDVISPAWKEMYETLSASPTWEQLTQYWMEKGYKSSWKDWPSDTAICPRCYGVGHFYVFYPVGKTDPNSLYGPVLHAGELHIEEKK